jgi:hypothetical protein
MEFLSKFWSLISLVILHDFIYIGADPPMQGLRRFPTCESNSPKVIA